jgi:thiosulfate/3-mercaptopyruvate sulfurtransferase
MGDHIAEEIKERGYAHPEKLVTTNWVANNLETPGIVILESDEDVLLYDTGHVPGAHRIDWHEDLNDPTVRDYIAPKAFAAMCSRLGITPDTTVVFYGDKSNWWACYALWVFHLFGHEKTLIMDGGRAKWVAEQKPLTQDEPKPTPSEYPVPQRDDSQIRAFADDVLKHIEANKRLVDVRSPQEYTGELLHMPDYPQEGSLRGGHIKGAVSVPWKRAANDDGTFKNADELKGIYKEECGLTENEDIIAYCRIGERSSHTWFVLKYLLGFNSVRNYDGSWTEWGNMVRMPIEKSEI